MNIMCRSNTIPKWYHNGFQLLPDDVLTNNTTLTILSASIFHEGLYTCYGSKKTGRFVAVARIMVKSVFSEIV